MSRTTSSTTLTARHALSAICGVALLTALAFGTTACEDKAIGRPCFIGADAGLRVDGYWSLEDHRAWVRASRPH